jgi:hypothetical protein
MGAVQTSYAASSGWTGSAVQLQCGSYASLRFHLRLFEMGGQTLGAGRTGDSHRLLRGSGSHLALVAGSFLCPVGCRALPGAPLVSGSTRLPRRRPLSWQRFPGRT